MDKSVKRVESINYEAQQFLLAFARFRDGPHAIDQSLCTNLFKIISEIDDFLDSKPKEVSIQQRDLLVPADLKKLGVNKGFVCKPCEMELGESLDNVRAHLKSHRHVNSKRVKNAAASRQAKIENRILPKKAKSLIQRDLQTYLTDCLAVSEKLKALPDYQEIQDDLLDLIGPAFPDQTIKMYLFGSRISGIGNIYSDLDIFVDIGKVFNNFENRPSSGTVKKLQTVQELLKTDTNWSRLIAIQNARVPILKIFHKSTSTNCDIGFSNSLGFCNTKLMSYLLDLQPLAKAMSIFMKKWLERTKLNEHITTYSTILLVVFFLQTKQLLPPIKDLQICLKDPIEIGPWIATFAEKSLVELNIEAASCSLENVKTYLREFFLFYSNYDFTNNVIAPYLGQTIRVSFMDTCQQLQRLIKYVETEKENKDASFKKTYMNVQDPFQLNHNVTKAVPSTVVCVLKQFFELSADLIVGTGDSQKDDAKDPKKK